MMHLDNLPNQRENEEVQLFLRRHWFAILSIVASVVLLIGVPAAAAIVFWTELVTLLQRPVLGPILTIFGGLYVMLIWLFAWIEYTDYYLDVWIVTNERILNTEQKGLFDRVASELHLISIQDVTSEINGLLRTFFDFGDVHIQTAGERARFEFKDIPDPEGVKQRILQLVEQDKKRHGRPSAEFAGGVKHDPDGTDVGDDTDHQH
jgi:hypothetical protein